MKKSLFAKISLFLALIFILTSCAGEAPELLDFLGDTSNDTVDFEGMTFRIYNTNGEDLRYVNEESGAATARHEMLLARLDEVENKYDCTILTLDGEPSEFTLKYVAGTPCADLINNSINYAYPMYIADYFIPLNEIPTIDLYSGKYGTDALLNTLTWNGDTVALYPQQWGQGPMRFSNAMVYNPEVFTLINHPTPNEYYEQGNWNWETLRAVGRDCISISTEDKPLYLSSSNSHFFRMLIHSNGGEYILEDENGKYSYGLLEQRVIEALQFGHEIYSEGLLEKGSGGHEAYVNKFSQNMYAVMCEYSDYGVDDLISTSSDDKAGEMKTIGYCYAPEGPQVDDNTRGIISNYTYFYFVTREKEEDVELLGQFMELLFAPLDEDPNEWVEEFKTMNFFDDMSAEVYMTQSENAYFDKVIFATDIIFDAISNAATKGNIMESLQSIESSVNANLDSGINADK